MVPDVTHMLKEHTYIHTYIHKLRGLVCTLVRRIRYCMYERAAARTAEFDCFKLKTGVGGNGSALVQVAEILLEI